MSLTVIERKFQAPEMDFSGFNSEGRPTLRYCDVDGSAQTIVFRQPILANGDSNPKTMHNGETANVVTRLQALAPSDCVSGINTCPWASLGCRLSCLDECGNGARLTSAHFGRWIRTVLFRDIRDWYLDELCAELARFESRCQKRGDIGVVRLNVYSDILWQHTYGIPEQFPGLQFYDYTKSPFAGLLAPNYWVTFSRSESNEEQALAMLRNGVNVAVCFSTGRVGANVVGRGKVSAETLATDLPKTWKRFDVIDGDKLHGDLRCFDPRANSRGNGAKVVGLRFKAPSWNDYFAGMQSGFAIPHNAESIRLGKFRA